MTLSLTAVWLQMLQSYQGVGIKYLRAMEPATYAWLYRHDRNWLNGHKPTRRDQQVRGGGLRVLWDARDQTLSVEVAQAVQNLQTGSKVRQIKLWQIYQAVPELKAKLAAVSRLPMTRRVIDKATQRHSANQETPNLFD